MVWKYNLAMNCLGEDFVRDLHEVQTRWLYARNRGTIIVSGAALGRLISEEGIRHRTMVETVVNKNGEYRWQVTCGRRETGPVLGQARRAATRKVPGRD